MGRTSTIDASLRNLISQVASSAAGSGYCMAHTANGAAACGELSEKENALRNFDASPLFTQAERAALCIEYRAGRVPNAVTDADFAELKKAPYDRRDRRYCSGHCDVWFPQPLERHHGN